MSEADTQQTTAELCQAILESTDSALFKYLSFYAAIHTAAITMLSSDAIGLAALSDGSSGGGDPVAASVLGAGAFLIGLLCLAIGRNLADATRRHRAAARRGRDLEGDVGKLFRVVYEGAESSGTLNPRDVAAGDAKAFHLPHARASAIAFGTGLFWGLFVTVLFLNGASGVVETGLGGALELGWGRAVPGTLGGLIVVSGALTLGWHLVEQEIFEIDDERDGRGEEGDDRGRD